MVKIGDRYCTLILIARGKFLSVKKKRVSAVKPAKPLMSSHFLLFPKKGIFLALIILVQIAKDIMDLKNTISKTGYS